MEWEDKKCKAKWEQRFDSIGKIFFNKTTINDFDFTPKIYENTFAKY